MIEAYKDFWKRGLTFEGVSNRPQYWYVMLVHLIIGIVLGVIGILVPVLQMILTGIFALIVLVPGICLTVRRLHDIGKSGAWIWFAFVPLVGGIMLLVFMCMPTVPNSPYNNKAPIQPQQPQQPVQQSQA